MRGSLNALYLRSDDEGRYPGILCHSTHNLSVTEILAGSSSMIHSYVPNTCFPYVKILKELTNRLVTGNNGLAATVRNCLPHHTLLDWVCITDNSTDRPIAVIRREVSGSAPLIDH